MTYLRSRIHLLMLVALLMLASSAFAYDKCLSPGEVAQAALLRSGDIAIVDFPQIGECGKCSFVLAQLASCLEQRLKVRRSPVRLAVLVCRRDIEVQQFARRHPEYSRVWRGTAQTRRLWGLDESTRVAIIGSTGRIIGAIAGLQFFDRPCRELDRILQGMERP